MSKTGEHCLCILHKSVKLLPGRYDYKQVKNQTFLTLRWFSTELALDLESVMTTGKTFLIVYKRHLLSDDGSHFAVWRRALEKSFEAVTDVANSGNKWALTGERLSILLRLRRSKRWKTERGSCFRHKWWSCKDIWGEWASVKIKNARSWGSVTNKNYIFPGYLALFRENLSLVPFTLCISFFLLLSHPSS